MDFKSDQIVKSCRKLESGLRLGGEGIHACQLGPFSAPNFWSPEEASQIKITKEMIVEKRKLLFEMLNDDHSDIACKKCHMVKTKPFSEVNFTRLGHVDLAATTTCNLRCNFCRYTMNDSFFDSKYDALAILKEFTAEDVEWDSAVDFNGGEPTLLHDFEEYINYFTSRGIRIFLYTNAVRYSQAVYDGLKSGSIRWVCTSLDAGTPSTYKSMKKSTHFLKVVENLTRYAHAGSQGGGRLAVKYIFCEGNCSEDDISGFTYAMLAIRPQKVWLTFDFEPLHEIPGDSEDFGGYDYSKHVKAYARMYTLMKKHGLDAGHFAENHLALVSRQGKVLLEQALSEIDKLPMPRASEELVLGNFREVEKNVNAIEPAYFLTAPLRIKYPDEDIMPWSLSGKKVVLAPACAISTELLKSRDLEESEVIGFLDRDPVLQNKKIGGVKVFSYEAIADLNPDVVLLASPEQHQADILGTISKHMNKEKCSVVCFRKNVTLAEKQ